MHANNDRSNLPRALLVGSAWIVLIYVVAFTLSPSLQPIAYPQPLDQLILGLAPLPALHIAKYTSRKIVFTGFGAVVSSVFWVGYLSAHRGASAFDGRAFVHTILVAGVISVLMAVAARFIGTQRYRWDALFRKPHGYCQTCGYNLTGNESGVCPECGEAIDAAE